jgi:Mn-dependent DtxR family transcriptional regulator
MIKIFFNDEQIIKYLERQGYRIERKEQRIKLIAEARKSRQQEIERKIKQAIKEIQDKGEQITANKVAQKAKVNWRTAKKYLLEGLR